MSYTNSYSEQWDKLRSNNLLDERLNKVDQSKLPGKLGGPRPEGTDRTLNAMTNLALLTDWALTSQGVRNGGREINPILGPKPSQGAINGYFLSFLLGNYLLPKILGDKYTDVARAQLLGNDIPCLASWMDPNFSGWKKQPDWSLMIPFEF